MFMYIRNVAKRRHEDEGASAVEYGLLVAAIAAVVILLVFAIGTYVKGAFKTTCDAFASAGTAKVGTSAGTCSS
jgi:pilus assembly protein Flp/PilA